jgi:flagellar biosynthesis/type III secretory pathway M-ring protein FliF/YscJ
MVDNVSDAAQLTSIKSAVEVAAGIDTTRGDQIVVESFAFDRTALDALTAELAQQQQQELYLRIGMAVGAALVVLALLFFVLRMMGNLRNASKESWKTVLRPVSELAALENEYAGPALKLQADLSTALSRLAEQSGESTAAKSGNQDVVVQVHSKNRQATATEDEQNSRVISRLTEENPATVAEIIQLWLNESKKS